MLTLYIDADYLCPWSWSCWATLHIKLCRDEWKLETIDLAAGEQREDPYAELSLTERVPMLVHDDFTITESTAITEYLEEQYPPPEFWSVFPIGARGRTRARQLHSWFRTDFHRLLEERLMECIFGDYAARPLSPTATREMHKLYGVLGDLLQMGQRSVFAGKSITLVDIEAAILLQRLRKSGDAMPLPLQLFAKEHWSHSHIQDWIQAHFRAKDHAKTTKRVPKPTPAPPKRRALRLVPKPE